jgi:aspartate-semialdehyde dehydrogenase
MKAKKRLKLALVGTDSLRGQEIKNVLSRKKLGAFDLEFFDPEVTEEYSKLTEFKKEPKVIHGLGNNPFSGIDLVFLASDRETNLALGRKALEQGSPAIDLSETFNDREDIPLIVAGINDGDLVTKKIRLVANPHPVTIILSHLFHLLESRFGIAKAVAFVLQPASAFNDAGIQELAGQSVALLNGAAPKKKLFSEQVAFNILSRFEAPDADGFCSSERRIVTEIKRVLRKPSFPLSLSVVQAPVFHTYSLMTYLELERDAEIASLEALFRDEEPFKMTPRGESCPASSITVSGKDEIFVGQIKKEALSPRAFWIWLVADNLTRGSALNAFDIANKILQRREA